MKLYAVIDATNAPELFDKIQIYDPPCSCLFNEPVQADVKQYAPYLVELKLFDDPFKNWLWKLEEPWGIFLVSDASFIELRKHLRHYTYARIPTEKKPVFFRYYDPRTIWNVCEVIDDWQLQTFLGPIELIATRFEDEFKEAHFTERRQAYPKGAKKNHLYLTFNETQYAHLNRFSEEAYIEELSEHMWRCIDPSVYENPPLDADTIHREMLQHEATVKGATITHELDQRMLRTPHFSRSDNPHLWLYIEGETTINLDHVISQILNNLNQEGISVQAFTQRTQNQYNAYVREFIEKHRTIQQQRKKEQEAARITKEGLRTQIDQFARDFVDFGKEQGITDDRSFKSLGELFIHRRIYSFNELPQEWISDLLSNELESKFRARKLYFKILDDPKTA